jgi:N-acetyl-anhydromuramyl-L-alanine amidase AmpD
VTLDVIKYGKFEFQRKNKKKKQIILTHTSRILDEYLASLKYRKNKNYDKIPHYLISREGHVLELLKNEIVPNNFNDDQINTYSIVICLENLGWLYKEPLKKSYINWIGNIYNGKVFERKWRDFIFWQPYTEIQVDNTVKLVKSISEKNEIPLKFIGHNTKINNPKSYEGVLTRSNYDINKTDLSPAFDFDSFSKKLEL